MPKEQEQRWYSIKAQQSASKATHADIYLYGIVGSWRVNIQRFLDEISQYKKLKTIHVYISTLGGTFLDGLPIYNMLYQHKAHITTINMGYCLSMGSHIMLAGDTRKSAQNAMQMLHEANTGICDYVNIATLEEIIKVLDVHTRAILPRYAEILKLSKDEARAILKAETWYTADEALEAGLIHEIIDPVNLEEIEQSMTEDHWQQFVKMVGNKPPENLKQHICSQYPKAEAHFKKLQEQQNHQPQDNEAVVEDDDMTPEQLEDLKSSITEALAAAVKEGMKDVSAKIEALPEALTPDPSVQKEVAAQLKEGFEGITTALTESSEKVIEKLETAATAQSKQDETLNSLKEKVESVENLPVNQVRIPEAGTEGDPQEPLYS